MWCRRGKGGVVAVREADGGRSGAWREIRGVKERGRGEAALRYAENPYPPERRRPGTYLLPLLEVGVFTDSGASHRQTPDVALFFSRLLVTVIHAKKVTHHRDCLSTGSASRGKPEKPIRPSPLFLRGRSSFCRVFREALSLFALSRFINDVLPRCRFSSRAYPTARL